ncbi:MAG: hypothetical protein HRT90_07430 [Candidatus Margulisbacteria bacterium]|nr:hypothetical protein [Candidatus Margulisiibacteriota bacterium]
MAKPRDFGLKIGPGLVSGIGNSPVKQVDLMSDFYFFSDSFRMTFGSTFLLPDNNLQLTMIESIGVQYQFKVSPTQFGSIGYSFFKPYIFEDTKSFSVVKGSRYYIAYHFVRSEYRDYYIELGYSEQPLRLNGISPSITLEDQIYYMNVGILFYF